ncbi:VanZ family protein [Modestobacter sp. I12A-02628]|uniref:VanZ family protein n=1 Tax=Goekera deserti TaxID=2497753 RepID=A0A7K3WHT3_9ACTN|nr:VanZ family protein [Goekera deserti]MPQ97902.1 VanZ family protein [Goekera deserti]NDI48548.1 VanZ family protein [Goekera deserti]NEL55073.1 VanZ family protein [Goekera deserti]
MGVRTGRVLLGICLLAAGAGTLVPAVGPGVVGWASDAATRVQQLTGLTSTTASRLVEPGLNVVLFLPLGLLISAAFPRLRGWWVWALCTAGSLGVEIAQVVGVPGRDASLRDVATNSLGAALGVLMIRVLQARAARRERALGGVTGGR